jgi:cytochrome P450
MRATSLRRTATWSLAQAPARLLFGREAKRGNPMARLIIDPEARVHPEPLWEELRSRGDLVRGKVSWATVSLPVVGRVLRGEEFSSMFPEPGNAIGRLYHAVRDPWALGPAEPPSLLAIDAPDHTRLRRLVSKAFTARQVAGMEAGVEKTTRELLDAMEVEDRVDLVERFAATLPVAVIADLLGVLPEERGPLLSWGNDAALLLDVGLPYREFRRAQRGVREMHQWVHGHIERLRADPGDDVISTVIRQADDLPEDERPSPEELRLLALLVLGAGFETTVNLIGKRCRAAGPAPRAEGTAPERTRPVAAGRRGGAALRLPRAAHRADGAPGRRGGRHPPASRQRDRHAARRGPPRPGRVPRPQHLRRHPRERR